MGRFSAGRVVARTARWVSGRATAFDVGRSLRRAGVASARTIPSDWSADELHVLYDLTACCPAGVAALELGAGPGAATCHLAAGLARVGGVLYCVDTWQEGSSGASPDPFAAFTRNTRPLAHMLRVIRKPVVELGPDDCPDGLGLALIAGCDNYPAARSAFRYVSDRLADGGAVVIHGHAWFSGVSRVVGEALCSGRWVIRRHAGNVLVLRRSCFLR